MPDYLHPGVYIEERPSPQTIEGVSTSTAGFVGATERGPTSGLPQLVTSFAEFNRRYGGYLPGSFLAYAVEGFFVNGGQRVYIARVLGPNFRAASESFYNGFVARLVEDTASTQAKRNSVQLTSLRGINVGSNLTFSEIIAGKPETQEVAVKSYEKNTVVLEASLALRYTAAGCTVTTKTQGTPVPVPGDEAGTGTVLKVEATSPGIWGNTIDVTLLDCDGATALARAASVQTALAALKLDFEEGPAKGATSMVLGNVGDMQKDDIIEFKDDKDQTEQCQIEGIESSSKTISWKPALSGDYSTNATISRITALRKHDSNPTVPVADTTGLASGDLVRLTQGTTTQIVRINTAPDSVDPNNKRITLDTAAATGRPIEATYNAGASAASATAGRSDSNRLEMGGAARNFYPRAVIEIDDRRTKSYHTVESIDGQSLVLRDKLDRDVSSDMPVRVVEFSLLVSDGTTRERFDNLSIDPDAPNSVDKVVNGRSRLVTAKTETPVHSPSLPFHLPRSVDGRPTNLTGGNNGEPPTPEGFIGTDKGPGKRTGIKALAEIDNISIVAAPGVSDESVHNALIDQCSELKDRFAVLDPKPGSDVDSVIVQRNKYDTLYAALYYPWITVSGAGDPVPSSGHVVGIYARVDTERGVFKAPANEVVRGITGVEVKLGDREQDVLNPAPRNINVIRDFRDNGRGIRVWGARCLTSDSSWKYIPVRRLFIFVEKSLYQGLQWVVFEPNAEPLWAKVRRTITGFLRRLWLDGALMGVSEDEAFFVRCDRSTMTEDDIANGRLIVIVGIAPVRPAEFVIIRIAQKTLEAKE
jgi:phage tail sheath protein FI